jgi:hypothetical protein
MKFPLLSMLAFALCLFSLVLALEPRQKSVIISFPDATPWNIVDDAKQAIVNAGGMITHEYHIFK